jgi:hypothetical protein
MNVRSNVLVVLCAICQSFVERQATCNRQKVNYIYLYFNKEAYCIFCELAIEKGGRSQKNGVTENQVIQ